MKKLGELVVISAFSQLMAGKPPASQFTSEQEAATYVEKNFSKDEISSAIEEEGKKIVGEYFKNLGVTQDL